MDEQLKPVIQRYVERVEKLREEINPLQNEMKRYMMIVNQLLSGAGDPLMYDEDSTTPSAMPKSTETIPKDVGNSNNGISVKTGEFYNRPLAKAAKEVLERGGGTMLFSEIIENLNKGGFPAKDEKWVRNTLLKNKHFDILPDKRYMIYVPKGKSKKGKSSNTDSQKQEKTAE